MGDARVIERIEAWEAIGLIDHETADRLRSAERAAPGLGLPGPARGPSAVAAFFGPAVTAAELFAYIGAAFVLAAWHTILAAYAFRDSGSGLSSPVLAFLLAQYAVPAIVFSIAGLFATGGTDRQRRFAGVAFGLATWHIFQTVQVGLEPSQGVLQNGLNWDPAAVLAAVAAVVAALVYRRVHPAVLTQVALLGALAFLASRLLQVVEGQWYWPSVSLDGVDPALARARVGLTIVWWLAAALVFGFVARYERRKAAAAPDLDDGAAARRATVSAWAAGLTAIAGTATAVMQSNGNGRAIEPWIGDAAILVVALLLLAIAFRRGAGAYLYPGALGLIVALTDLNSRYVAEQVGIGVALLVEGVILLGAGLFADRLRRRLGATGLGAAPGDDGPAAAAVGGARGAPEVGVPAPQAAALAAPPASAAATSAPAPVDVPEPVSTVDFAAAQALDAAPVVDAAPSLEESRPPELPDPIATPTVELGRPSTADAPPAVDLDRPSTADAAPGL
jgi:hypothetical protein